MKTKTPFLLNTICFLILSSLFIGCKKDYQVKERTGDKNDPIQEDNRNTPRELEALEVTTDADYELTINTGLTYQEIDNFSASDAWSAQFIGLWPIAKTGLMANWLFSTEANQNGDPKGIGLSAWRFNIGAGSIEQGDDSDISDKWRRTECFLQGNGTYNWDKQRGQRFFLKKAKERGVNQFIGFSNSPPVYMTKNGLAHGTSANPDNLSINKSKDFAGFLVEVIKGVKQKEGIEFTYVHPVNEPQYNWDGNGQEGCHTTNEGVGKIVEELDKSILSAGLNTKIIIPEAANWKYLYEENGDHSGTGNQIEYFFGGNSSVKDAPSLSKKVASHSYFTTTPVSHMISVRETAREKAAEYNLQLWSTEYCPLQEDDQNALGWSEWKKDSTMHLALYIARIIHYDLTVANASTWHWWRAFGDGNYPDGLIYTDKDETDGSFHDTKLLWVLGNFSRFIRPNAKRVEITQPNSNEGDLLVSAYHHETDKQTIIVVINMGEAPQKIKLKANNPSITKWTPYVTNDAKANNKLFKFQDIYVDKDNAIVIPPKTVISFVGNGG